MPKVQRKLIATFTENQLRSLLAAIDRQSAEGYRDYAMIVTLLDTALRVSELTGIRTADLSLDEGLVRVIGKGGKERLIPLGREARRVIWQYLNRYRPRPWNQNGDFLFLTRDGGMMTKNRIETLMKGYGQKAGITGVRCSPHTLRHTAAVMFLRNGGNVFSLQRLLGHSSLEMTRHYCELADVDVIKAHKTASPVDSLYSVASRLRKTGRS
jgi:site-specific recombinase XerD